MVSFLSKTSQKMGFSSILSVLHCLLKTYNLFSSLMKVIVFVYSAKVYCLCDFILCKIVAKFGFVYLSISFFSSCVGYTGPSG